MSINSTKIDSSLVLRPQGSEPSAPENGEIYYDSTLQVFRKYENGFWSNLSSAGGKNYISNSNAEGGTTGYVRYQDAASNIPTNGTSGSPIGLTLGTTTSSPLSGVSSFELVKDNTDCQGSGVSYDFTIDREDQAKLLTISFSYRTSGAFFAGDGITPPLQDGTTSLNSGNSSFQVFMYDVTNSILIPINPTALISKGSGAAVYTGVFQTASNSLSYRLILHCNDINLTSSTLVFDSVSVAPMAAIQASQSISAKYSQVAGGTTSANTPIKYDTKIIDTNNAFNTSTRLFTCPVSGIYHIESSQYVNVVGVSTYVSKNGASFPGEGYLTTAPVGAIFQSGGMLVQCLAGDTLSVNVDAAVDLSAGGAGTAQFSVLLVSSTTSIAATGVAAASMYTASSGVSVSANTPLILPSTVYDTNAGYASNQYTIPASGFYEVSAYAAFSTGASVGLVLYKNGTALKYMGYSASVATAGSTSFQALAGDIITVRPDQSITQEVDTHWEIIQIPSLSVTSTPATVAASVYLAAATSFSGSTAIIYDTPQYDTNAAYSTVTGVYTVPVSGIYRLSVVAACITAAAQTLYVAKNGTGVTYLCTVNTSAFTLSGSTSVQCLAGDQLAIYTDSSIALSAPDATAIKNQLSIEKVG